MDFMKGIVTLAKVDEMYNSLQKYKSLLVTVYLSRGKDGIRWTKFLLESALECPCVYYSPSFVKGHASSCKRYSCRERDWYCNVDETGAP